VTWPAPPYGWRKFIATLAALASATVLVWLGKIEGSVYSTVVLGTVGVFIAGNVMQKFSTKPEAAE
jgi:Co/Zn/Cd efflux system component